MGKNMQSFNEYSKNEKLDLSDVSDSNLREKYIKILEWLSSNNKLNLGQYGTIRSTVDFYINEVDKEEDFSNKWRE